MLGIAGRRCRGGEICEDAWREEGGRVCEEGFGLGVDVRYWEYVIIWSSKCCLM